jgi:hypothetical protein
MVCEIAEEHFGLARPLHQSESAMRVSKCHVTFHVIASALGHLQKVV